MEKIIKKIAAVMTVSLTIIAGLAVPAHAQQEATVILEFPEVVQPDSTFTARVTISEVTDFDATNYNITFNPEVLSLINVTAGNIGGEILNVDIFNLIPPNTYTIVQNNPGLGGISGSGYLSELLFHVIGEPGESTDINIWDMAVSDIQAERINVILQGGSVTIYSEEQETEETGTGDQDTSQSPDSSPGQTTGSDSNTDTSGQDGEKDTGSPEQIITQTVKEDGTIVYKVTYTTEESDDNEEAVTEPEETPVKSDSTGDKEQEEIIHTDPTGSGGISLGIILGIAGGAVVLIAAAVYIWTQKRYWIT